MEWRILLAILLIPLFTIPIPFIVEGLINNPQKVVLTVWSYHNNTVVPYSKVYVYQLTEDGPKLISSGTSDERGVFSSIIGIPRVYKGKVDINGSIRDVYASVNLLVIASKKDEGLISSLAFSIDPSFLSFPIGFHSVKVNLRRVRVEQKLGNLTSSNKVSFLSYTPPNEETWQ